jgi:glycosyltransferase involved in cell wall biosynthesis
MAKIRTVLSINASWNLVNFRLGLIRGLQEAGHEVVGLAPADAYSERLAAENVEHRAIAMDVTSTSPLGDIGLLLRYWRALRALRPTVYLGYTAKPNIYGSLAAHSLGIAVINNVSGLGTAFMRRGPLRSIVTSLYRLAFRRSATVFFQNEEDRDLFVTERIVRPHQARLLPGSGIDIDRFRPVQAPSSRQAGFTFLLIARLLRDKGVAEYVEAARQLRRHHPNACFQLLGFLDVANRTAVSREEVNAWVDEGLIDYLGASDDVRPFIAAADCIVLPSYREGLPRTLLEGAAMAKPLIATDVPGCRQVVDDGVNGFLCAVKDAGALADAMARMISLGDDARGHMGEAARSKVVQHYDERIAIRHYLEAIGDALAAR